MTRRRHASGSWPRRGGLSLVVAALALSCLACQGRPVAKAVIDSWLAGHRPFEPRLSADLRYRPCTLAADSADLLPAPACDPLPELSSRDYLRLTQVRRELRLREGETPSAERLHSLALWHLIWTAGGESAAAAIAAIEGAARLRPEDPTLQVDLAAAHLMLGRQLDDPASLSRALAAATRAVELDPGDARAHFNRALALEQLQLTAKAREAWNAFLELERDDGWRGEAEAHLQTLSEPDAWSRWTGERERLLAAAEAGDEATVRRLVDAHRQAARAFVEVDLLPTWAEASLHGEREAAAAAATAARTIGQALVSLNGEQVPAAAMAAIDAAAADRGRVRLLASGHRALTTGQRTAELDRSLPLLARAESQFLRGGSPAMVASARFSRAIKLFNNNSYDSAASLLTPLLEESEREGYHYLSGRCRWLLGTIDLVGGQPARARRHYLAALDRFEASGELGYAATLHSMVAASYASLGAYDPAWRHHLTALERAVAFGQAVTLQQVANTVGDFTVRTGDLALSLEYQNLAVENAARLERRHLQADTLIWRAFLHSRLGNPELGRRDLGDAAFLTSLIRSADLKARTEADLRLIEALIAAQEDPGLAIDATDVALPLYEASGNRLFALLTHTTRAGASWALGNLEQTELDLERSIELHESFGREIPDEAIRLRFAEQARSAFDQMIRFQLEERRDPVAAFAYAERERRLSAPESGGQSSPLSRIDRTAIEELKKTLPAATEVVTFSVLEERLVAWLLGSAGLGFHELEVKPEELRSRLGRLSAGGDVSWGELGDWLYDQLLRPWIGEVPDGHRLVIVPDKLLHTLPWTALFNRERGRYLIEEHTVLVAPSATLFLAAAERDRALADRQREPVTLVVADPAFDSTLHSGLSRLPAALAEGEAIHRIYAPDAVLLSGEEADRERFIEAAAEAPRIHFAGHGVVNARDPLSSMLVLAPGENGVGALTANDIYKLTFPLTRLVTLSACDTGVGDPVHGESAMSLARPFLAAGVPAVVASLWKVDDREAAAFFVSFHRRIEAGTDAATALREAQLEAIEAEQQARRRPPHWSAFQIMGGVHPLPSERSS